MDANPIAGIIDVAVRAGVSPATVSRALRGLPGVATATRETVAEAAAALGYVASRSAAALSSGRTNAIGVITPWAWSPFCSAVIAGAYGVVNSEGYDLLLYPAVAIDPGAEAVEKHGLHKRVDGALALHLPGELQAVDLQDLGIPLVTVGFAAPGVPGVLSDDVQVGYLATKHLLGLGHRRIVFFRGDPDQALGDMVVAKRQRGCERALHEAGLAIDPRFGPAIGRFGDESGEHALLRSFWNPAGRRLDNMPSAVFAVSDEVAMGVLYAARELGIRVPAELSVIGVGNLDLARRFGLATISQRPRELGNIAARTLLKRIRRQQSPTAQVAQIEPAIITRYSTGTARQAELPLMK